MGGGKREGGERENYYSPFKKKEILSFVTWMNQKNMSQVNKASTEK